MSYDSSFRAHKITVSLTPAVYQYKFIVDGNWFTDPNNPVTDGSMYNNSQLTVSDPMITYFWPLDTALTNIADLQPIKAIIAHNSQATVNFTNFTLKINGNTIPLSDANYSIATKIFKYQVNAADIINGRNTVSLTVTTPNGSKSKTTVLNISSNPALDLLTEDIIYKKPNIMLYGKTGNAQVTSFRVEFNGSILPVTIDSNKAFVYPVTLIRGNNVAKVTLTSTTGVTEKIDTFVYKPDIQPVLQITNSTNGRILNAMVTASSPLGLPLTYNWFEGNLNPVKLLTGTETGTGIQVTIPGVKGEYIFKVKVTDQDGNFNIAGCLVKASSDSLHIMHNTEHAGWIDSLVLYEIFTPTYGQTKNGLKGVLEKMDHIANLGVNAIWMTPIFDGDSLHGYSTRDYYKINKAFGTENDLKLIVQNAHAKGIRVILDLVISHTWTEHPFFKNVLNLKGQSPFASYYNWSGAPGSSGYSYYYDWTSLPNLNVTNQEVINYLINMAAYWVREYDIDGYRCDVAWGIELRNSAMWKTFRKELKKIKPEIFLLAESPADNQFNGQTLDIFNQKFDAAYDWTLMNNGSGALYTALNGTSSVPALNTVLARTYPANSYAMHFLENHDISRAASQFGIVKSKLGHTIILTANGIPLIFGGAEVGELTQRNKINWTDPNNAAPYFKRLMQIKRQYIRNNAALVNLPNSSPNTVYSYLTKSDSNTVLTVANFSTNANTITVNFTNNVSAGNHKLNNLLQNTSISLTADELNAYNFTLAANEAKIFLIDGTPLDINKSAEQVPASFRLSQNYPNPFNPSTTLQFELPEKANVQLTIYNYLGEKIATLLNQVMDSGYHSIQWNAAQYPSGVYFYEMRTEKFSAVKKLVLMK